jgi:signal peptidase I
LSAFTARIGPPTRWRAVGEAVLAMFQCRPSDKLKRMEDDQGSREPAMTQPHEPGGIARDTGSGGRQSGDSETGGAQVKGAATQDEAAESGEAGEGAESERPAKRQRSFWRELPVLIVVALALTVVIKIFAVQAFFIPSSSMENTLEIGDRVLVNKVVYHLRDIHRGDIVVFNGLDSWDPTVPQTAPSNPIRRFFDWIGSAFGVTAGEKDYVKRVIGLPGDRVACCDAQGRVTVNGVPLNETSYLYPGNSPSQIQFNTTVPRGELWVMGDHRAVSYDSREHRNDPGGGSIPEDKVIGRAFVIVWPLSRFGVLPIPATFEQKALAYAVPTAPLLFGVAGALPVTLLQRRIRVRRKRRPHRPGGPGMPAA